MRGLKVVLVVVALLAAVSGAVASGEASATHVRFTAAGDYAQRAGYTDAVLRAMAQAGPDANFALGDLSYGSAGGEQAWCDYVKQYVGEKFPFELLSGDHESNGEKGNINDFSACLPNQLPGVVGTYGRQYYVDLPQNDPLVRVIGISPGLTYPDGTWDYRAGSARYQWTSDAIDSARADGVPWVVVNIHKPCITTGTQTCDSGLDVMNLMLSKKVDLVLGGNEHTYLRSKQLGLGSGCPQWTTGPYNASCVVDSDDDLTKGAGTVFMTIGTGGAQSQPPMTTSDPAEPYIAAHNTQSTYGFSSFDVTPDRIAVSFTQAAGNAMSDTFTITKGTAPPPNQSPVARFSTTTSGLTASFDASGSSDPDGYVTSYSWDFGDGTTGSGVTPQHTYAAGGDYPVKLTVVDDGGTTDSTTQTVTVTAPGGTQVLASDTFQRTLADGWGDADQGGPWTVTGGGVASVSGGSGQLTAAAGREVVGELRSVSSTSADLRVDLSLDKVPGAPLYQDVVPRQVSGDSMYQFSLRFLATGAVKASLVRKLSGNETMLTSEYALPQSFSPGDVLHVRGRAVGTSPTTLALKIWKDGTPEPADWQLTATDSSAALQGPGNVRVLSYLAKSAKNGPVVVSYDNLEAVSGP